MNLIEKYVEVAMEVHGFRYKREVVDHLNETLDTRYPYTALNNWASDDNPRPVPRTVVSLMRETVLSSILREIDSGMSRAETRKYIAMINSEPAMREQLIRTLVLDEIGENVSGKEMKTMLHSLEPPYVKE